MERMKRITLVFIGFCLGAAGAFTYASHRDAVTYDWMQQMNNSNLAAAQECNLKLSQAENENAEWQAAYYKSVQDAAAKNQQTQGSDAMLAIARAILK
jgi:hypothetical protein